jgi:excisionase family DNA binding protein
MILETMSVREAAEYHKLHIDAIYQAVHSDSDKIRAVLCGKQIRVLKADVENYQPRDYPRKAKGQADD